MTAETLSALRLIDRLRESLEFGSSGWLILTRAYAHVIDRAEGRHREATF